MKFNIKKILLSFLSLMFIFSISGCEKTEYRHPLHQKDSQDKKY